MNERIEKISYPVRRATRNITVEGELPIRQLSCPEVVDSRGRALTVPGLSANAVDFMVEALMFYREHLIHPAGKKGRLITKIVLPVAPRTKKNHQMIGIKDRRGVCPSCKQIIGTRFIMQGSAYKDQVKEIKKAGGAVFHTAPIYRLPLNRPVCVECLFFRNVNRDDADTLNYLGATDDILVDLGILADDKYTIVRSHGDSDLLIDRAHPRTEVYIYEWIDPPKEDG